MTYSFDTSAILDGWVRYYPPSNFPTFWDKMDGLVLSGKFKASRQVLEELEERDDDVHKWLKGHTSAIIELDDDQFAIAKAIEKQVPGWATKKRNGGDPFVIALAEINNWQVITGEREKKTLKPAKTSIPDVCNHRNVSWGPLVEVVKAEGWTF